MMGNTASKTACLMADHLSRGVLLSSERSPSRARLAKASRDPDFRSKVMRAAAALRALKASRHHDLADALDDARQFADATGAPLPHLLEERSLLARLV